MTITFEALKDEVLRLAAESPAYVYASPNHYCMYNASVDEDTGKPIDACIFGRAFTNLGQPVPLLLEKLEIIRVLKNLKVDATVDEQLWADDVQSAQDTGVPWGEDVYRAAYEEDDDE